MHVTEEVLAPLRERYGPPVELEWSGAIDEREHAVATYDPARTHDVTLFILDPAERVALIRKPHFERGIWRPPGGGIKRGEDFAAGAVREALEETGLRVALDRYLVASRASFSFDGRVVAWRTHVFSARTTDTQLAPRDAVEIAGARWGTLEELAGPLRERLLATGRAFWRYRVALHDAALEALGAATPRREGRAPAGST
ncbi:MAG TPA: NUDIX hydrolase [Gaiellaceae bacterium]|nr:NUDIX hydrolase [Gaiellaceae bacterium]